METNLLEIKQLAAAREHENVRFRTFLKCRDSGKIDKIVYQLHSEITQQIDCTLCGNCCRQLQPELHKKDIATLARLENITPKSYKDNYCEKNEDGEISLKTMPCRYLKEKKCCIYENRPEGCKNFPYTDKEKFTSRLISMLCFYKICPIVFNLIEILKDEMRFRR
jgi:Fe-S-cluster containining protein